jgi:carbonic anhydrase/acetyltransferase-like protein (isoleucine patch superfamily)
MAQAFEVVTDNGGRIHHYLMAGVYASPLAPAEVGQHMDGGERVLIASRDPESSVITEYDLTESGGLVHPDVEVGQSVELGIGVRLDAGVTFRGSIDGRDHPEDNIVICDGARVKGTEIAEQVLIGKSALILAQSIGLGSMIGDFCRVAKDVVIQQGVILEEAARIDRRAAIQSGVVIETAAKIGYKTVVGTGATIRNHAQVGQFTGAGIGGINRDGPLIAPHSIVSGPRTR